VLLENLTISRKLLLTLIDVNPWRKSMELLCRTKPGISFLRAPTKISLNVSGFTVLSVVMMHT
jgi:hypothetical protein